MSSTEGGVVFLEPRTSQRLRINCVFVLLIILVAGVAVMH